MLREAIVVPELPEEEDLVHGHGETILLVEDNKTMLETNKVMLESLGYRLLTAEDGHKALKLFDRHRGEISVVLTDLAMPEMNGVELMQELNVHNLDIKVILMTSYPLGEEMRKLLSRGVIDWVRKPVNFVKLSQVIGRALRGKSH
jgi:CheY-like chemotaxis protein